MITINANLREPIFLRHAGEENALRVAFDLQEFEAHWPGGVPALLVRRPISSMDVAAYPVPLSVDGRTAFWTVSASDTECSGYGKAQLQWRVGGTLAKSCVYDTVCAPSLLAGDAPPDAPSKAWFEAIQGQIGDLSQLTTKAKENLVAAINEAARTGGGSGGATGSAGKDGITPTIGANGNWYLGDIDTQKPSRGEKGDPGAKGADGAPGKAGSDGYSPEATVTPINGGAKIIIKDRNGTTSANVMNGAQGPKGNAGPQGDVGPKGADGKDGANGTTFTPSVSTAGILSWTNDGGKANPAPVNLKGPQGDTGPTGPQGLKGDTGPQGPQGPAGDNANVTKDAVVGALGFTPISADDVPVKSVNGQTGEAKTNWYFNVTGSVASPATTQTTGQIVAAQETGFAPICSATFSDFRGLPATLPALVVSSMVCVFGGIGSTGGDTFYLTVMIDSAGNLTAKTDKVATKDDIPTIPTELKNPYSLNIKIGDTTTSYDGSAEKTVEIPKGVPSVTAADNGKILRVVNGAWAAAELLSAGGASF